MVIGAHGAVFFWLGLSDTPGVEEEVIVDVALTLVPEWVEPPVADEPRDSRPPIPGRITRRREPIPEPHVSTAPSTGVPPVRDWQAAAEVAAQRATAADGYKTRDFSSTPGSPYRDCERKKNNFEWKPDAKRTGWANGLPYVRMGKRCVVGLGFFGCAMGELPQPDGTLLEDMNTANQMEGSVPGVQDCVITAPAP